MRFGVHTALLAFCQLSSVTEGFKPCWRTGQSAHLETLLFSEHRAWCVHTLGIHNNWRYGTGSIHILQTSGQYAVTQAREAILNAHGMAKVPPEFYRNSLSHHVRTWHTVLFWETSQWGRPDLGIHRRPGAIIL